MATKTLFDFSDLSPQECTVKYGGNVYVLREPSEGAWAAYQGVIATARQYDTNGKFTGLNDRWPLADSVLVAACLSLVKDGAHRQLGPNEVQAMPHRVVDPLVDWLKDAAQLPAEKDLPKSSASGQDTSDSPTN